MARWMFWRHTAVVGPLGCNCTIVADLAAREAIVIDPGGEPRRISKLLRQHELHVRAIVHTHAHIEHVYATAELTEATGAPAHLHPADRPLYDALDKQAAMLGIEPPERDAMVGHLHDEQSLPFGQYEIGVLHTPGHTPGSVSFNLPAQSLCVTGDTLFANGVGRTDLWGGNPHHLRHSIEHKLMRLPDETTVVPGHGLESTIGAERRTWPLWAQRLG